jgi:hypothetical protein
MEIGSRHVCRLEKEVRLEDERQLVIGQVGDRADEGSSGTQPEARGGLQPVVAELQHVHDLGEDRKVGPVYSQIENDGGGSRSQD